MQITRLGDKKMAGYWDIHNHILPGVDDGSGSMAETIRLVQLEYEQGVRRIIFTPHYRRGMFEVALTDKEEVFHRVCEQLSGRFPEMKFYLGCEYYATPHMMERILADARYRMPTGRAVLVEFSYTGTFATLLKTIEDLRNADLIPVIAHFERYECLHKDRTLLSRLKQAGAVLQMNCDGILGKEGFKMKRFCMKALKEELVDLLGSDAHNTGSRSVHIGETAELIQKKMGADYVQKLLQTNPGQLFDET